MLQKVGPALAALVGVAGAVVSALLSPTEAAQLTAVTTAVVIAAYAVVGVLILARHPGHRVGEVVVLGAALWGLGEALLDLAVNGVHADAHDRAAALAGTLGDALRALGWLLLVMVLPLLFPDGRRAGSPRVRRWAWRCATFVLAAFTISALLVPTSNDDRLTGVDNPIGLPASLVGVPDLLSLVGLVIAVAAVVLAIVTLVQRWRHDDALVRQQLLWFALAFAAPVVLIPLGVLGHATPWMFSVASIPVPLAIAVSVLQHRLYDIPLAVNRSLTYGALSVMIAGLYAVTVGGVGATLRAGGAPWLPWVGAGVVAVSFVPLRDVLQRGANRLVYGRWSQPAEVLAATGRRLADATDVPALLEAITAELGAGLGLTHVEICDAAGQVLASSGVPAEALEELPLTAYGVRVGVLRWHGRRLRDTDRALLVDLANQLGGVVHSAALLGQVRDAQERQVLAREEERKRLRRDLHDGLGPALAALTFGVDTLRNRLAAGGPVDPDAELLRLRDGISSCVADVRRIVEGLRPPALDELGLAGALDQLAARLSLGADVAVQVEVGPLPPVPAAVEVAAYRVAQEALTNVVRHARACRVRVEVSLAGGGLLVQVRDDGTGAATPRPGGVGLGSMHERARELGGSLTIDSPAGAGTLVRALLPLSTPAVAT